MWYSRLENERKKGCREIVVWKSFALLLVGNLLVSWREGLVGGGGGGVLSLFLLCFYRGNKFEILMIE